MGHLSRTDLRKGSLKKENIEKAIKQEADKPKQMDMFSKNKK